MLSLVDVSYHPPATPQPVLQRVSFGLPSQSLSLIVGVSGAGKTTLLELIAGLATPTQGKILWREQPLQAPDLQELAGLVFQFPERHFCGLTLLEELRLGHPELTLEQVQQVLTTVHLRDVPLHQPPHYLSGGQQRRLALAVQLIRQPYLLLLDEPLAGLDWSMRRQVMQLLQELKRTWALLVVSHDTCELSAMADQVWCLEGGRLRGLTG
ncbi:ABC transporter-like protein [Gloeomargarita lithophora Alchichica-D10]|uniref:ABC transporter-like protein n=1 Tax=Gloeomargarita lithophora Alchichica-D10 TaxID=1188229 RepID=A0A1J0AA12_9CYAN|nr:ABC transporter ATP-binding protein [Gloeomargarita lithophora]APB32767.1 ABC transporter-like protein [Gloeomargarita lithophora Alchichica-D10]